MPILAGNQRIRTRAKLFGWCCVVVCWIILNPAWAETNKPTKAKTPEHRISYQFHGINSEIEENIVLQLERQAPEGEALTPDNIREYFQQMPAIVEKAIHPYGYFQPTVESKLEPHKSQFSKRTEWQAKFYIDLGRPVTVGNLVINISGAGEQNPAIQDYLKDFPIRSGQILNSPNYENAKQAFFDIAYQHGYLNAQAQHTMVEIDIDNYTADIDIHFDTGQRFYLGEVQFDQDGPHPLGEKYLRRFIQFNSGQPYSPDVLVQLQQDLITSGHFESVQVFSNQEAAVNYIVPIGVKLILRKRNRYTFGIGYGTDTSFRGTAAWERKRVNARGHQIGMTTKASSLQKTVQAKYTIPGRHHPATDSYNLITGYQQTKVDSGDRETEYISVDHTKFFRQYWQRIIGLTFVHEHFEPIEDGIKLPNQTKQLLMPSLTYAKIKKDDPVKPKHGERVRIDFRGAYKELSSSTSFFQAHVQGKLLTMPTDNIRWIIRAELGYTAVEKFNDLPLSQRFQAGGAQSVRGYDFESLGPGRYLGVLSLEHQYRVYKDWFVGGFVDVGDASNDFLPSLKKAVGVSLSWLSPVGTISVSAAKPLDRLKKNDNKNWLFQFNLGPDI